MIMRELIGRNIERLRMERGLTQEELAHTADLDQPHVARIERGKINVTVGVLERLVKALRARPVDLFEPLKADIKPPSPLKRGPKGPRR